MRRRASSSIIDYKKVDLQRPGKGLGRPTITIHDRLFIYLFIFIYKCAEVAICPAAPNFDAK